VEFEEAKLWNHNWLELKKAKHMRARREGGNEILPAPFVLTARGMKLCIYYYWKFHFFTHE
jgi:hypothetical protein